MGILFLTCKIFIINIDPPEWEISFYQPVDEMFYISIAYNLFENGNLWGESPPSTSYSILTNFFTYLSLEVFGDNYLGLRFSSLFFSLLSFVLFFFLLKKCTKNRVLLLLALIFFVLNFSFTTASIVVEPTMGRILTSLLSLWLVIRWKEKKEAKSANLIWQAAVVGVLFLFSYPTNAFVVIAAYLALVIIIQADDGTVILRAEIKKKMCKTGYFAIGIIISLIFFYLINLLIGVNLFEAGDKDGTNYSNRLAFDPFQLLRNLLKIVRANIFRFNPLFLILVSLSLFGLFRGGRFKMNKTVFTTLLFLTSFFAQTAFINDFPERKLLILLPFLLLITVTGLEFFWKNLHDLNKKNLFFILLLTYLPLLPLIYWEKTFLIEHPILIITALMGTILLIMQTITLKRKLIMPYVVFLLLLLPEFTFFVKHYIIERPDKYKIAYQSLAKYDGYNFIGGFSIGFGLYNDILPVLNPYRYKPDEKVFWKKMEILSKNQKKDYSIGYREQENAFREIGFKPLKILMPANNTVNHKDWILYEEIKVR